MAGHIHIIDNAGDEVAVISTDTANGTTAVAIRTYNLPLGITSLEAGVAVDGNIHIADNTGDEVVVIAPDTADGARAVAIRTYDLPTGITAPRGIGADSDGNIHVINRGNPDSSVAVIAPDTADGARAVAIRTYLLPTGITSPEGAVDVDGNIHVIDNAGDEVAVIPSDTADGVRAVAIRTYNLPTIITSPRGITLVDDGNLHIADTSGDDVAVIPTDTADGVRVVASRVYNLPLDITSPEGLVFIPDSDTTPDPDATLTITTTDTDIRAGESVDINIASDEDISGFVASDITVTGGTRGALTINSATSATLAVTAGSAGTMTLAIAEDAVSPGNTAVSQAFTVNARATATITFDDTTGESGGSTGVNIAFGESVTGLQLSELTASAGTLSNLTGSGTSWEADLAFPATGSGTITISLAIDSTSPQNAAASASITYAEAVVAATGGGRLYFIATASDATATAIAYDFDRVRQSADDIPIGAGFFQGGFVTDTRIYFVNNGTNTAVAYDFDLNRQAGDDISLDSASWQSAVASDTRIFVVSDSGNTAVAYNFNRNRQAGDDIPLGTGSWAATARSDNRLYFVNSTTNIAVAYDFDLNRQVGDDISLGAGSWRGGLRSDTRIYFVDGTNARAYDYSGTRQSADDIALGAGRWQGGTTIFFDADDSLSFGTETIANQAGVVGTANSITLPEATGGTGPITYSLSPTLPSGKTFTASTRVLAGTPTGRFTSDTFTYTAEDADGTTVELTFTIVVTAPSISFASTVANQALVVGTAVNLTLPTASGGVGSFTYSLSTGLPSGITFTAGTRALAGNPTGRFSSATFTYTATDAEGVTHTLTFTIVVTAPAISFASTIANQSWQVGTAVSLTLPTVSGGVGAFVYSLTPALPASITFTAGTRVISGTPTAAVASATYTFTATDSEGIAASRTFTIIVAAASSIVFSEAIAAQAWVVGTAVSLTLPTATGGVGTISFSLSPTLPTGFTFTAGTRVLAGNPTGRFTSATFTYTAEDADGTTVNQTFTIVVTAPSISFASTVTNQAWIVGTVVNLTLPVASGGVGAFTYSLTPTLPGGATFTPGTRVLSGNPTGRFSSATFTYTAEDVEGITQAQTFTIVVTAPAITFSPTSFANQTWTIGTAVNLTLPEGAGGVGDLTPTLNPSLPSGIGFTASTRALAGNPTATFASATFTYTITDDEGESESITFTIIVNAEALSFNSETIANQSWRVGTAIASLTLPEASGGDGTNTYSLSPTLPSGITFTANSRLLSGNPTAVFTSTTFTYTVTDDAGSTLDLTFTVVVAAALIVLGFGTSVIASQAWVVGTTIVSLTLPEATGGHATKNYSLSPATPAGLTFTASTRILSGTPTGRYASASFTYTVTDGDNNTAELTFTVVITATITFDSTIGNQVWIVDEAISLTLPSASGGVGAKTHTLTGTLPLGIAHSAFAVTGTPTVVAESVSFVWIATDIEGVAIQQSFTITVTLDTREADRLEAQRQARLRSILPISASRLEVDLLDAFQEVLNEYVLMAFGSENTYDIPIRHLWDADTCPPAFLPFLASAMSVDTDLSVFTVDQQRSLIRDSFEVHRRKGTVGSMKRLVDSLGWTLTSDGIIEGYRDPTDTTQIIRANGGWAQFSIHISNTIPTAQARAAAGLIQQLAPISRRLYSFDFSGAPLFYDGGVNAEGDYTFFLDGTFTLGAILTDESLRE